MVILGCLRVICGSISFEFSAASESDSGISISRCIALISPPLFQILDDCKNANINSSIKL